MSRVESLTIYLLVLKASFSLSIKSKLIASGNFINFILFKCLKPFFALASFVVLVWFVGGTNAETLSSYVIVGGIASVFIYANLWGLSNEINDEKMQGTLVLIMASPASRLVWLVGKALAYILDSSIFAILTLSFGYYVLGLEFGSIDLLALMITVILMLYCLFSFGALLACLDFISREPGWISNFLYPMILCFGGLYFPISLLPPVLQLLSHTVFAPVTLGVEAFRNVLLYSATLTQVSMDWVSMAIVGTLCLSLTVITLKKAERRVKREASLSFV